MSRLALFFSLTIVAFVVGCASSEESDVIGTEDLSAIPPRRVETWNPVEEIRNEPSPEFQLAAYYALSKGYNKKIDLHDEAATLGFSYIPYLTEKAGLHRKFDPNTSE